MSRRALVDDYLRAHDPLGLAAEASATATGATAGTAAAVLPGARPTRRRPRALSLFAGGGALTAALALAVVLLLTGGPAPSRTPGFLSPADAVAAAARNLDGDGILHWVTGSSPANQNFADHRKGKLSDGRMQLWVDLKTLASHSIYPSQEPGGPSSSPEEAWYNGQRSFWARWPSWSFKPRPDGRAVVMRTVRRRGEKILITRSPLDDLRDTLALAATGKATLREMPPEHGVPVVRIREAHTAPNRTKGVTMTWITREAEPRILRTEMQWRDRGRPARSITIETETWEILPRTQAALEAVAVPDFDPAKYVVRTQFLGPPKR